jgi:hypothetical protein
MRTDTPMLTVVTDDDARGEMTADQDEICRQGAYRMLAVALEAVAAAYTDALSGERDEHGRRLVVRNVHAERRTITTSAGPIEMQTPRVNDRRVDPDSVSADGSRVRSCRRGAARARRWPRCFR